MTETADSADVEDSDDSPSGDRATHVDPAAASRMVDAIVPEWSVERVRPSEEGTDYVAFLTVETPEGRREVVLKAFSGDGVSSRAARSEPRLLRRLHAETSIPVPEVVGFVDDHPDLPAPFFLAERLPGENGAGRFADLPPAALERVFAAAGDHLAQLHGLRSFDRFGQVGVKDGEIAVIGDAGSGDGESGDGESSDGESGGGGPGDASDDESTAHEAASQERWTDWLLADAEATLDGLAGGRFDDLVGPLREYVREAVPALDGPERGALVHWDYRLGNLLVDPDSGETTGVLDWADLVAGDPVYNLATVEDHNVNWQTRDVVLRRRLREAFYGAYESRRTDAHSVADFPSAVRDRKRVYHLCTRLNAMACLPDWYAGADQAVRDERAAEHRAFVREYLE